MLLRSGQVAQLPLSYKYGLNKFFESKIDPWTPWFPIRAGETKDVDGDSVTR